MTKTKRGHFYGISITHDSEGIHTYPFVISTNERKPEKKARTIRRSSSGKRSRK